MLHTGNIRSHGSKRSNLEMKKSTEEGGLKRAAFGQTPEEVFIRTFCLWHNGIRPTSSD
ncbi:17287_t:CDS:2 [Cetraspora pellucida]|uniref:17287_t:CDS:1 n=1 Tax=Cetraspora pellucida TaxID=1433469 RepID=A0ACA9KS77_9GLOM|nr:17287_t:CDS:2 [Cetraspora pellucida]